MMKVGIPAETAEFEKRIAATPETVKRMVAKGLAVKVQSGAGEPASISDDDFRSAGAEIAPDAGTLYSTSDIILKVQKPLEGGSADETALLKEGTVLLGLLQPLLNPGLVRKLADSKITALSIDMIPRIARAQRLDALSSQSNISGYKAAVMGTNTLARMMPMMMTAAGTISPARVLVLGAGVAGLQAIATAKRLGALVEAFDTRPVVKEQVESLGAKFIALEVEAGEAEDKGGYAKELSREDHERELALVAEHTRAADIVITTAQIPGKPSPKLVTRETVEKMKPGSVIVDLAVEGGGNCELSEPGKVVVKHGVTLIGHMNVPSLMAVQASQLYARNISGLLLDHVTDGVLNLKRDDEIVQGALITEGGDVVHPAVKELLASKGGA